MISADTALSLLSALAIAYAAYRIWRLDHPVRQQRYEPRLKALYDDDFPYGNKDTCCNLQSPTIGELDDLYQLLKVMAEDRPLAPNKPNKRVH